MARGCFIVAAREGQADDLHISLRADRQDSVPDAQQELVGDLLRTLSHLHVAFPNRLSPSGELLPPFRDYFTQLVAIGQIGLTGDTPQIDLARRILNGLRDDIIIREASAHKNRHLIDLGRAVLIAAGAFAAMGALFYWLLGDHPLVNLNQLLTASMAGVWVSFGARKVTYAFSDIATPDEDRLKPWARVVFVSLLTTATSLLFVSGAVEVRVGSFSPSTWPTEVVSAALFGFVLGFSEQVLATRFGQQAGKILDLK
ncbi:MAG: hypothetical protein KF859_10500 [Phycisphaeraceae bacterium]|nr:hypothetical protein [Phycisphaeraceae bacterium]